MWRRCAIFYVTNIVYSYINFFFSGYNILYFFFWLLYLFFYRTFHQNIFATRFYF
nr:MAG TPA: hypothetical protein [Crassvirales sp.]DAX04516.1 MAG TPA: hypothetical protein [Bacteriophage sp.]